MKMTHSQSIKRPICTSCGYPKSTCLCPWIKPIQAPINVIILQHPKEHKHAKNTVKLLNLGLQNVTILQGEKTSDWMQFIQVVNNNPQNFSLIYPHTASIAIETLESDEDKMRYFPNGHNVILIDASWRKALKIWHLNPWLHSLQSWHFSCPPDNQYEIRKTKVKHSLSTLESVAYVLEHTHNVDCCNLRILFRKMQEKQFISYL